MEILFLKNQDN